MNAPPQQAATPLESLTSATAKGPVALPPMDYAFQMLLKPVKKSLERIETQLQSFQPPTNSVPSAPPVVASTNADIPFAGLAAERGTVDGDAHFAPLYQRLDQLSSELADFRREALSHIEMQTARPPVPEEKKDVAPAAEAIPERHRTDGASWDEIILGKFLCSDPSLQSTCRRFLDDLICGCVPARALAGQLLLLQATAADELPERFRYVGEAYYRWRPSTAGDSDPFERSLADWLTRRAEGAGLRNSIQLVRPGDRFDSARHSATTRGVEVVAVHGWVVLRDNQKVYTKASVTVQ